MCVCVCAWNVGSERDNLPARRGAPRQQTKQDSGPNESNIRKSGSEALPEIHIAQSAALRAGPEQAVESAEARSTNALNRSGELVHQSFEVETGRLAHSISNGVPSPGM